MKIFFDHKDEKITEKAFSQSMIISVVSILLCLVALCSMTYAWFTSDTTSGNNTLKAGSFDVKVDIVNANDGVSTASETVLFEDGKYKLTKADTYTVILSTTADTTVKGYCVVTINGTQVYRTGVIVNDVALNDEYQTKTDPFSFTIKTYQPDTVVEIEAHWGVPAEPTIKTPEPIEVGTAPSVEESVEETK